MDLTRMPRPQRAYGRPSSNPVIPADWETSHAPVVQATMTATVDLRKPGSQTVFDEAKQQTVTTPLPAYATGQPARIQAKLERPIDRARESGEDTLRVTGYLVTLPLQLNPDDSDLIDVTACTDPLLVGKQLRVIEAVRGTLRFERDVLCEINN